MSEPPRNPRDRNPRNRAMMLTPPGVGAIAVVRIVGQGAQLFLQHHFSKQARVGRCVHGDIADQDRVIDDAVVVLLPDERGADVNLHGGSWVVSSFLDLTAREGFAVVDPLEELAEGESELEREMLAALPLAKTRQVIEVLLAQPTLWEAYLKDSANGPLPDEVLADRSLWWMLHPPRVAIVGEANVGKSTLANQLFAQERSITADVPGTTRDWVGEEANLDGLVVTLVDTPGLRETSDAIERAAIAHSVTEVGRADLVVLVLDGSRELNRELLDTYPYALRVINKVDQGQDWASEFVADVRTVATPGTGVPELRRTIRARFGCEDLNLDRPRCWTQRQRELLERLIQSRRQL
jgi:tRNA modification GTPase